MQDAAAYAARATGAKQCMAGAATRHCPPQASACTRQARGALIRGTNCASSKFAGSFTHYHAFNVPYLRCTACEAAMSHAHGAPDDKHTHAHTHACARAHTHTHTHTHTRVAATHRCRQEEAAVVGRLPRARPQQLVDDPLVHAIGLQGGHTRTSTHMTGRTNTQART